MHLAEKLKADYNMAICRTKTRIGHLGYSEVAGINITINEKRIEAFRVKPAKKNRDLSYPMHFHVCAELYETSDFFQQLAASGNYVYAGGFMTRNNEGGVIWRKEGAVLGVEANNDVSMYCLAQDKAYDKELDAYVYSFGKERYDEALQDHFVVPGEVFSEEEMERRKRDVAKVISMQSNHEMFKMLSDEAKSKVPCLSREMFHLMVSQELSQYDLDTVVGFCVDCHLMPWVSYAILQRVGLEVEPGELQAMILDCFYGMEMKKLNELLKKSGRSALAIL